MRDTIKSKEYFDEYILKMSEGIKRFEEGIAAGKYLNDKILFVKDYILQKKIGIIIAKYSKGDSIEEIKKEFERITSQLGLTSSAAINLFIAAVIRRQGIPFDLVLNDEPNAETYKAMDDAENRRNLHGPFKSFEEMMDDINA